MVSCADIVALAARDSVVTIVRVQPEYINLLLFEILGYVKESQSENLFSKCTNNFCFIICKNRVGHFGGFQQGVGMGECQMPQRP